MGCKTICEVLPISLKLEVLFVEIFKNPKNIENVQLAFFQSLESGNSVKMCYDTFININ